MQDLLTAIIVGWILFRLLRPVVVVHWNKPNQYQNNSAPNHNSSPEGEIRVKKTSADHKKIPDNAGEYVDYEEIK